MNQLAQLILTDASSIKGVDLAFLRGKTVLITGATGLLGNYLTAFLKYYRDNNGINFNLVATASSQADAYYYDFLNSDSDVFLSGDLTDQKFLTTLPAADLIIHAAGYGQPGKFMNDQVKTLQLNTSVTLSLFEKLNTGGKFLFVSSSEVYNGSTNLPYKESDIGYTNTDNIRSCYIEGKRSGEAICFAYSQRGVEARVARLSLAYGPGTKKTDERVLNNFIAKGLQGSINLLDFGLAGRTYCYITDAIEIIFNIITSGQDFIYNVGGESKTTIGDLAKKIASLINVPLTFPLQAKTLIGAPADVSLDLTKVKNHFNKHNFVSLEAGLVRTIEWQKILYSNNDHQHMKKYFITGGLGYIGTKFAQVALSRGDSVMAYDNLLYEQDRIKVVTEITKGQNEANYSLVIGDIRNLELLRSSLESYRPDYVLHFAELSSVYACDHNPSYTEDINYSASKAVLALCEELKIPVLYNSSSSVYGNQKEMRLMAETDELPVTTDNYCKNKLKMEAYIKARVEDNKDFKIIVFRPATVFGLSPRFRIELLPNHFTYCAIANGLLRISELNAFRAAIDIEELVAGYFKVIDKGSWDHLIYNIGHHNLSKMQFAAGIQTVVNCKIAPIADIGDLRNLQIDNSLFNQEFAFRPSKRYEDTIKELVVWLEMNLLTIEKNNFAGILNMSLERWKQII